MRILFSSALAAALFITLNLSLHADIVPDEFIVRVEDNTKFDLQKAASFFTQNTQIEAKKVVPIKIAKSIFLSIKLKQSDVLTFLSKKKGQFKYVEANYRWKIMTQDELYPKQWNLENTGNNYSNPITNSVKGADLDIVRAWEISKGDRQIKIAVIDTGIDYNHPDLSDNIWINGQEFRGQANIDDDKNGYIDDIYGYNFVKNSGDPMDDQGHGTHCAGIIGAAHNNFGIAGVMANVSLMALKFIDKNGDGSTEGALRAIEYALAQEVDVLSNSWGGGEYSQALFDAIAEANKEGIIFVAAAGNFGENNDNLHLYPASYKLPNIVSVGSHGADDELSTFSSYGEQSVDLAAPGEKILSSLPKNKYGMLSGTSMAAPHVAGMAGLYLSVFGKTLPAQLKEELQKSAIHHPSYRKQTISGGRANAYNLLAKIYPPRFIIPESSWIDYPLQDSDVFETKHNYNSYDYLSKTYQIANARYVRPIIKKMELRELSDILQIKNGKNKTYDRLSGIAENLPGDYVDGDTIKLRFSSKTAGDKWGILIEKLQYIP
ncbi:MAG: hypothetical protein A2504_02475 [Bdellovibrionales bacterium RIFOXYD12_FULL_39_22]|nr:MAG: hypothetical protein A2385_12505 [Bdellovibrionales bacterium RIFOXYB1_FULL_39_21]OFZ41170.1 MAG: hypothetical protein A2485_00915 [Bdellovibrionales bacterium RIFOXYC12_FULL_39_17]OFZ44924.1 MAG: hypothetical protein A2404_11660 [Bdellovibrionales bacterium RIFOXYC1_FULL_39_130]OFZ73154.1 MAG: hypothetical protein A2451_11940 [Bdellovibrionales bacterium RIFOXYC2_FULL_39_8]OFZ74371.1 MAG: hypothetical protein A2560_12030 [Bdellovibrionales bacterium RIFOXYD1_FULL_39_84]OFZ92373.1 MAG: